MVEPPVLRLKRRTDMLATPSPPSAFLCLLRYKASSISSAVKLLLPPPPRSVSYPLLDLNLHLKKEKNSNQVEKWWTRRWRLHWDNGVGGGGVGCWDSSDSRRQIESYRIRWVKRRERKKEIEEKGECVFSPSEFGPFDSFLSMAVITQGMIRALVSDRLLYIDQSDLMYLISYFFNTINFLL